MGGVKIRVDCGDLAVVRVEYGVFEQKAERGHFWDEYVAGAVELCFRSVVGGGRGGCGQQKTKAKVKLWICQGVNGHVPRQ